MNYLRNVLGSTAVAMYVEQPVEVLQLYRAFLKAIPRRFPRKLEAQQKLREAQWLFRELKDQNDAESIRYYKTLGHEGTVPTI